MADDQEGPRKKARTSCQSLTASIGDLLSSGKYSDLEIRCDGKSFKVHRNIVCGRSAVMDKECDGGFVEAQTRIIKHTEFDASAMDRMLQFMYRSDYELEMACPTSVAPSSPSIEELAAVISAEVNEDQYENQYDDLHEERPELDDDEEDELVAHVHVYAIADYYELPGLQELAVEKFTAARTPREYVSTECILEVAYAVYANTTKQAVELRRQVVSLAFDNELASLESKVFMEALANESELQEFSADLLSESHNRHGKDIRDLEWSKAAANQKAAEAWKIAKAKVLEARTAARQTEETRSLLGTYRQTINDLQLALGRKDAEISKLTRAPRYPLR